MKTAPSAKSFVLTTVFVFLKMNRQSDFWTTGHCFQAIAC